MKNYFDQHPFYHSLFHAIVSTLIVVFPIAANLLPTRLMDMSLSGAILLALHWLENA